jgi:predicted metalloprotease with PDZ domain
MARSFAALLLALLLAPACGPAPAARCPELPPAPKSPPLTTTSRPAAEAPDEEAPSDGTKFRVAVSVKPVLDPAPIVEVEITARGPASDLDDWTIAAFAPGSLKSISARDIDGAIAVTTSDSANAAGASGASGASGATSAAPLRIHLVRPPLGPLRLTYSVATKPNSLATTPAVELDPDRFRAQGQALLAVPDAVDEEPMSLSLTFDLSELGGTALRAASSLGVGASREGKVRARDVRELMLLAGHMGSAVFTAQEGHDEAAWVGYTVFDPRPIAADVASFRTAVGQVFKEPLPSLSTLLIIADGRQPGGFVAARRAGGVLVHVGVGEPWTAPVRIAVASETIKAWIGERLWIGPTEPEREAEALWFTEGVTRHLARDLLFRFGLITSSELLDEVHGLAGMIATSPRKAEGNAALAKRAKEPGVLPLLAARGALYATRVDALLRKKTGGKASLETVLRVLYEKAREQRGPLPLSAWSDTLSKELGLAEVAAFDEAMEKGKEIRVPDDALGPCFKGGTRRYELYDLGFDLDASHAGEPRKAAGVRAGGPAAKAGLRDGDVLVDEKITRGRSDVPVTLTIERDGAKKTITYKPAGPSSTGQGWSRVKDVPEESCAR